MLRFTLAARAALLLWLIAYTIGPVAAEAVADDAKSESIAAAAVADDAKSESKSKPEKKGFAAYRDRNRQRTDVGLTLLCNCPYVVMVNLTLHGPAETLTEMGLEVPDTITDLEPLPYDDIEAFMDLGAVRWMFPRILLWWHSDKIMEGLPWNTSAAFLLAGVVFEILIWPTVFVGMFCNREVAWLIMTGSTSLQLSVLGYCWQYSVNYSKLPAFVTNVLFYVINFVPSLIALTGCISLGVAGVMHMMVSGDCGKSILEAIEKLDVDGDEELDEEELWKAVGTQGVFLELQLSDPLKYDALTTYLHNIIDNFEAIDTDKNQKISTSELKTFITKHKYSGFFSASSFGWQKVKDTYDLYDADGDGYLSKEEKIALARGRADPDKKAALDEKKAQERADRMAKADELAAMKAAKKQEGITITSRYSGKSARASM